MLAIKRILLGIALILAGIAIPIIIYLVQDISWLIILPVIGLLLVIIGYFSDDNKNDQDPKENIFKRILNGK